MSFDPAQLTISQHRAAAAFAANANTTPVDISQFVGQIGVVLNIGTATAGTNPTYNGYLATSNESNGANSVNVPFPNGTNAAFTQATAAGLQVISVEQRRCRKYLFVVQTIGGTDSPSFPVAIATVGQKQVET